MASRVSPTMGRDRIRVTPGDGRRYRWDGGTYIHVDRIVTNHAGVITFEPTGEAFPAPEVRTAATILAAVAAYRGPYLPQ